MSLGKITFGTLILSLVSIQISSSCDETTSEVSEKLNSTLVERNKSVSSQIDSVVTKTTSSIQSYEPLLDPDKTPYMLKGAAKGAVAFPFGLAGIALVKCLIVGTAGGVVYLAYSYPLYVLPPVIFGISALGGAFGAYEDIGDRKKDEFKKSQ